MDVGLFIAASGMVAEQTRQDQLANDLSNATTPGYKADSSPQHSFGEVLLANTRGGVAVGSSVAGRLAGQDVHRPHAGRDHRNRRTARLRDRGSRLLRGPHRAGRPLHAQRAVHRLGVGDPDRRQRQPGPERLRNGSQSARPGHARSRGGRDLRTRQRRKAGRRTCTRARPRAKRKGPSARARSRARAWTPPR